MSLKVGILLDSWNVRGWQASIIDYILAHPQCKIAFVAINNRKDRPVKGWDKLLYSLGRRLDRTLFRAKFDCFELASVEKRLSGSAVFLIDPISRRYTDAFSDLDVSRIGGTNADIIIRFGFRILTGGILQVSKYGVWSLHHGDTAVNRGGPPGFWEIVKGHSVTGVTLQVLSDELDGGRVIDKAFTRTNRTSFNRNQNDVFWAGIELFCSAMDRQTRDASFYLNACMTSAFYSHTLYRDPSNWLSFKIFVRFWARRLVESSKAKSKQWRIYLKFGSAVNTLYKFKPMRQPKNVEWADPFIIEKDGYYYLFFEELVMGSGKAHIAMVQFDGTGRMVSDSSRRVLEENFHLSYPFVFEYQGSYYMTPECGDDHRVWLYLSERFPYEWKKIKLLIEKQLYDPTLFLHNGVWYLFATERPFAGNSPNQYLVIYFTDDLLDGEWTRHPKSPCTRDVRLARPAGRIIDRNGILLRPAQVGAPNYGYGVVFMQIMLLTKDDYKEVHYDAILPMWHNGIKGVHTFNHIHNLTVIDVQVQN